MLGPENVGLGFLQVALQGLDLPIALMQHRVEAQVAEFQLAYLMAELLRRHYIALAERRAQAVLGRVTENHQDAFAHCLGPWDIKSKAKVCP
nr:hypothetical protein FFPRI1PSEUD_10110 [Pseudomonas sp. FFPRI_1]